MSYDKFKNEVFCFLLEFDGEAPNEETLKWNASMLAEWQNRKYVDIDWKLKEEIEKVKEGKPDGDLKKLLNLN